MTTPEPPPATPVTPPPQVPPAGPRGGSRGRRTARVARARVDATTVAAVVVPLLVLLVALLVHTGEPAARATVGPEETPLSRATVVCPTGARAVQVASTSGASGEVEATSRDRSDRAEVAPGTTSTVRLGASAVVLSATGDLAPGLVAGRFATPTAGVECRAPAFDQWFTGVGASAGHRSALQLVNPDEGGAVVDVTVLGQDGVVPVTGLRGITLAGGEARTFRLSELVPRADDLALHVTVARGRVAANVLDTSRDLGAGRTGDDGVAAQDAPSTTNLLLGVPDTSGPRTLVLANPGDTQGRATISLVTGDSVFAPSGLDAVEVGPQSVVTVQLAEVLRAAGSGEDRAVGIQVSSDVPLTSTVSMYANGDLASIVPAAPLVGPGTSLLPGGTQELVLGGARSAGTVAVEARDAAGEVLLEESVEVAPGRAATLDLPGRARLVTVTPARTSIAAVVTVLTDDGATVVRVREPLVTGQVPHVEVGRP